MLRRWKFWLILGGTPLAFLLLLLAVSAWLVWQRSTFSLPSTTELPKPPAEWWKSPPPLTNEEVAGQFWLSAISWQLPRQRWSEYWNIGGGQYGVSSIRYQAAFSGYAAASLGMRTPAYPALTGRILESFIEHLLDRQAWRYITSYWKDHPAYPDPVAYENIMYSGHLMQLMALHEAMTGDTRYRTEGFDFVWDDQKKFHHDLLSLTAITVEQMRGNECGGVACEPGLVFFSCNNHPQIALRLLEGLGLGDWSADRAKWEKWALSSYRSVLGGGAFKYFYYLPRKAFVPIGHPAFDAWSLLWYVPWASNPAVAQELWKITVKKIDWEQFDKAPLGPEEIPKKKNAICHPIQSVPSPVAATLAAAARACGDIATAERLEKWLEERFLKREGDKTWIESNPLWRIGVTANWLLSRSQAHGSDFRSLVQRPLPRDYFQGPLLAEIEPANIPVFQAWRPDDQTLIIELEGRGQDVTLHLAHVKDIATLEGVDADKWTFSEGKLHLSSIGRVTLKITVEPPSP